MIFTSINTNYNSPKGRGWFINPFVRSGRIVKDPNAKTCSVTFDLCVQEESGVRVIESTSLSFNEFDRKAKIEIDGVQVELIPHLQSGGAYNSEDVTDWGVPAYDELNNYFVEGFAPLEFRESPMKFLAVDWALNNIKVEGLLLKNSFVLQE